MGILRTSLFAAALALPAAALALPGVDTDSLEAAEPAPPEQLAELERRRPGPRPEPEPERQPQDPNRATDLRPIALPPPNLPRSFVPLPDRWRLVEALGVNQRWYDPYNQNTYKADRPLFDDWFLNLSLISDTVFETRKLPVPVGPQAGFPGALDVIGGRNQALVSENLVFGIVLFKGDTVFRPPDWEFRLTTVFNYNRTDVDELRAINIDPTQGTTRIDDHVGIQELFVDKHLRNVSARYDFDSIRVGIQPFSTDFRGFLFQDNQLGVRLFGNRDNNLWQYNLAWFRRIEKDINSGLNELGENLRHDDILIANVYRQDFPVTGFTSQVTVVYNRNREDDELFFDQNGFLQRPAPVGTGGFRNYDVTYLGYNGDGHIGRLNLTASYYWATGRESSSLTTFSRSRIDAHFLAAEASMDFDWVRLRLSGLYASGDSDPFDDRSEGFDAIFENPVFAGADTSFWIRQAVPNIGGGAVSLSGRNGILNALRTSKEQGQSNFTNPGTTLIGIGADFDVTPELRLSANINRLGFADTTLLELVRQQGQVDRDIGWDVSVAAIWRPLLTQNIVLRLSGAVLYPGDGFRQLFGDKRSYSVLANLVLTY